MLRWLISRAFQSLITLAIAATLMFFLMRWAPGDPLAQLVGERQVSAETIAALRARYGLDQPLGRQFAVFAGGLLHGDLGVSITHQRAVTEVVFRRLPASLLLGGTVLLLNFTVGLALGVWQARRKDRAIDRALTGLSLAGYAMPSFWLGLLLVWLLSIHWQLFPPGQMEDPLRTQTGWLGRTADLLHHLALPAFTLSVVSIAATMRYQRAAMLEVLQLDFIRTARAQGLPERSVIRHAWRNALFPVVTLFGLWLPLLVTGSVFVESVFAWPGLGLLAQEAINARDYPLLMGTAILVAAMVVTGGFLTDITYALLDPRVRFR